MPQYPSIFRALQLHRALSELILRQGKFVAVQTPSPAVAMVNSDTAVTSFVLVKSRPCGMRRSVRACFLAAIRCLRSISKLDSILYYQHQCVD